MPNWTSNSIYAEGAESDLKQFLEAVKGEDQLFDFNRIIPMPELLKHTATGQRKFGDKDVNSWYIINPDADLPERFSDENERGFTPDEEARLARIGYSNWYDWCCENWGTKWNARDPQIEDEASIKYGYVRISFDTAWDAPLPVLKNMIEMFPALSFSCRWRHEDEEPYPHALDQ